MYTKQIFKINAFTLIELIITMTLLGIISAIVGIFISGPIIAFNDTVNRSELVDSADMALKRMERDIRSSVPNSVRVKSTSVKAIEMVNAVEGVRYRVKAPGGQNARLKFNQPDDRFDILGTFQSALLGSSGYRLVIYNTGAYLVNPDNPIDGINVYGSSASGPFPPNGSHVITPAGTTITLSNSGTIGSVEMSPDFQFALESPRRRMYVVDTPITYICDLNSGTITRYSGYSITSTQPTSSGSAPLSGGSSALLAQNVSACDFTYEPGITSRTSIVTISITLSRNDESVRLLQQVHVSNAP